MEAAMKLSRQYFLEKSSPEPSRCRFISRKQSYHGITLGALSLGGHEARRAKFSPMLLGVTSSVSPCFAYRGQTIGETTEAYVVRLAQELEDEFIRVGPETVCAFVAEPVVGAVRALPGPNSNRRQSSKIAADVNLLGTGLRACRRGLFQGHETCVRQIWSAAHHG